MRAGDDRRVKKSEKRIDNKRNQDDLLKTGSFKYYKLLKQNSHL